MLLSPCTPCCLALVLHAANPEKVTEAPIFEGAKI